MEVIPSQFEAAPAGQLVRTDVEDSFAKLYYGKHRSKLAWADSLRNAAVFEVVRKSEPPVLLDVGCGDSAALGRFVASEKLDTAYIGMDVAPERTDMARINALNPRRPAVGFVGSAADGLPCRANFVACLGVMEAFCKSYDEVVKFFVEVQRVLPPLGYFVLACPDTPFGMPLHQPQAHAWEGEHKGMLAMLRAHFLVDHWFTYRTSLSYVDVHALMRYPSSWPLELKLAVHLPAATLDVDGYPGNKVYFCRRPS